MTLERQKTEVETKVKNWLQPEAHAFAELKRKRNRAIGVNGQISREVSPSSCIQHSIMDSYIA